MGLFHLSNRIEQGRFLASYGVVGKVRRDSILTNLAEAKVGSLCEVRSSVPGKSISLEIVSLDPKGHVAMPLDDLRGVRLGERVYLTEEASAFSVGEMLLGQVIDSMGNSYQTGARIPTTETIPLYGSLQNPLERSLIDQPLDLGIRSINGCLTCGRGQRQGIFAGSGVGKSVLLGMMARYTEADVVVIALVGERGREVKEFLEHELGSKAMKKTVVIVETAERSAVRRTRAAYAAASVCDYFRKKGAHVLFLMDSLTRFAMAQREIGIAAGEPPTTKGYPPSVYSAVSRLVERAGNWGEQGSVTGLYTVLVEGDDLEDPVADNSRAILDGHIVLSRNLANRGQYPAIDILSSVSRVMNQVTTKESVEHVRKMKSILSRYQQNEDAIQYGMYVRGSDPAIDECIEMEPKIRQFLEQARDERAPMEATRQQMDALFEASAG